MPKTTAKTLIGFELRPEAEFLLCCARTRLETATAGRLRDLLGQDIDWPYLVRLAGQHGLAPLLYWNLNAHCSEAVPPSILNQLRSQFQSNVQRNLFLTGELLKLIHLFEKSDIPAIAYKGPVLAISAYGNLALRTFDDLDIVIHPQDVLRAKELLVSNGYGPRTHLTDRQEKDLLKFAYAYEFDRPDGLFWVELHWGFAPSRFYLPLNMEDVWDRAESINLGGIPVYNLGPEVSLMILCFHLAQHCWRGTEQFRWICDLAELIRRYPTLDWDWILEQANVSGSRRMLFLGLFLAHDLLDAPIPAEIWARVSTDSTARSLATQVSERFTYDSSGRLHGAERYVFYLRMRERWLNKIRCSFDLLRAKSRPNAADQALVRLPAGLQALYYLLRPIRLVKTYGLSPVKSLLKYLFT